MVSTNSATVLRKYSKLGIDAYLNRIRQDCIVCAEQSLRFLIDSVGIDRVVFRHGLALPNGA